MASLQTIPADTDRQKLESPLPCRHKLDLLRILPPLKWLVSRRWFQFVVILPNLAMFLLFIVAGIFGTPVGNRNIIIVVVWILWWFLLIALMVPFASRVWCIVCPFPFFGEWMQRGTLIKVRAIARGEKRKKGSGAVVGKNRYFGKNLRWPKALSNIWLQNIGFLALCTFSAFFLTRPIVSVIVLGGLIAVATVLHMIYRQRAFCSYVCPVSGFLSLFAMSSTMEVRSKDQDVCAKCKDKGCLAGNERGWGCPWFMYPSKMDRNNYCGLCMECIKTCPDDNITLNARAPFADTMLKGYDEAWKAFIMLTLAATYSVLYLGPWGTLKDWANVTESGQWGGFLVYVGVLWTAALLITPALYWLAVRTGRTLAGPHDASPKEVFLGFAYSLVPLGLLAWIAFSFPLILANGSYIPMVLSDPFGWGWDLFGTAHLEWTPVVPHWTPYIQVLLLLIGLYYALGRGFAHAERLFSRRGKARRAFAPVAVVLTGFVVFFIQLYAG